MYTFQLKCRLKTQSHLIRVVGSSILAIIILAMLFGVINSEQAWAMITVEEVIELDQKQDEENSTSKFHLSKPIEALATPMKAYVSEEVDLVEEDVQNLNILWGAVVTHNPIIQYGIQRMTTPPSEREIQNRKMARVLNGLISGAALMPMAMGADQVATGASLIGRNVVSNKFFKMDQDAVSKFTSDRELIELSGLVQDLQQQVIIEYFQYKRALSQCVQNQQQQNWIHHQENKLLTSPKTGMINNESIEPLWLNYYRLDLVTQYKDAQQIARDHLLGLERLVGFEAVEQLKFADKLGSEEE